MPLTIPNLAASPTFDGQTVTDATDLAAIINAMGGNGVISGGAVAQHTGSDMNVSVAAVVVAINGTIYSLGAVASTAVGAASATDRRDIVSIHSAGTITVTAGTACGTAGWSRTSTGLPPVKPAIPADNVILGEVYVGHGTTTITTAANITDKRVVPAANNAGLFPGKIAISAAFLVPLLWLAASGGTVSRTTYAALFANLCPALGNPTMTIASPCVVTLTAHGLVTGDTIYLTTTGALPTGLSVNTLYWVIKIDANTFNLATSRANAVAGTKINTSGTQSGTHTINACPYGLGDGSTTFGLPNLNGSVPLGSGTSGQAGATLHNMGQVGGEETHLLTGAESGTPVHGHGVSDPGHFHHNQGYDGTIGSGGDAMQRGSGGSASTFTASGTYETVTTGLTVSNAVAANASSAHNNLPSYEGVKYIIYAGA